MQMNEDEIRESARRWHSHPVLGPATRTLESLMTAVNGCSDGWPYWQKPRRSADRLMELITDNTLAVRRGGEPQDDEDLAARLRTAYSVLRRFRTSRAEVGGIKFRIYAAPGVAGDPEPEPERQPVQHQIRITVRGNRATVTVAGNGPLAPGRYMGAVVRLTDDRERVA